MSLERGKAAPAFTLPDQNGDKHALKDYRGKHVIVYFYPRDNTPGCTKQACGFRDLSTKIEQEDAVVLGVSPDSPASHGRFIAEFKLPFTLLSDPGKKVMTRYGAWGEKVLYGKKTTGVIRSTVWVDPQGKVKKHWKRVAKAADHAAHVLKALREA